MSQLDSLLSLLVSLLVPMELRQYGTELKAQSGLHLDLEKTIRYALALEFEVIIG